MTLPASGAITMAQVNTEMNISPSTTAVSLNDAQTRNLAVVPSGSITLNGLHSKYQNNYTIVNKPGNYVHAYAYTADSSGNIYCVLDNQGGIYVIAKYDQFYNLIWQRGINVSGVYDYLRSHQINVDSSGNIFLVGFGTSTNGAQVIKLNSTATSVLWAKEYQITSYLTSYDTVSTSAGAKTFIDGSGNFYFSFYQDAASTSYTKNAGYIKIDTNGNYLTNYGASIGTSTSVHLYVYDMAPDSTGSNLVFGGVWWPTNVPQGAIWKISTSGSLVWQKVISYSNSYIYSTAVDSSGNVYAAGTAYNGSVYYSYVVKLDSSGNIQWSRNISAASTSVWIKSVVVMPNGNICASGWYTYSGTTYGAFFVYNSSGALQFSRVFSAPSNGIYNGASTQAGLGFVCDAYNNVSLVLESYNPDTSTAVLITKAPMLNNSNKLNATTITTTLGSSTFTLSSTASGITEAAGSVTLANGSWSGYTTPTELTSNLSIPSTTSNFLTVTAGMT